MPRLFDVSAAQNFFSGGLPQDPAAYVATSLQELDLGNNRLPHQLTSSYATSPSPHPPVPIPAFCQGNQALIFLTCSLLFLPTFLSLPSSLLVPRPIIPLRPHPRLLPGQPPGHPLPRLLTSLFDSSFLPALSLCLLLPPIPSPSGPIPAFCQGNHQAIRFLNLASNALSGPPTPLSSPSCSASLAYLNLSSNRLSGSIPATVSSFNRLKRLSLYSNALTGAIPAGVSKMKHLLTLRLSYNNLTGSIPAVWPKSIRQVLLAGNRLSGPVPAALSKLKRGSFKPGNDNLCGKPLPACA
ncbi:unnamed protein product [Closterium sp. Naga37s-1]|nr:unnamed protein product [Closterium sp. Naga37s-1]